MRIRVSRRTFLVQSSAASTALCLPSFAWAQEAKEDEWVFPDVSELVKQLPPQVRYVAPRIPDSQNGYLVYRQGLDAVVDTAELYKAIEERLGAIDYENLPFSLGMEEEPIYPTGAAREVLEAWLDRNDRAYALAKSAATYTRGAVAASELEQAFLRVFSDGEQFPFMKALSLYDVVANRVLRDLEGGDSEGAMASILVLWQLARLLRATPGTYAQALHTNLMSRYAMLLMRIFARHPAATEQQISALRDELTGHDRSRAWLADSLRLDIHYFTLPLIHAFDEAKSLTELSETLIRYRGDMTGVYSEPENKEEQEQIIRDLMAALFAGHPQPFDTAATLREVGERVSTAIDRLNEGSNEPIEPTADVVEANKLWPRQLIKAFGILTFELEDLLEETEQPAPLTPAVKAKTRSAFLRVENPLGKLIFLRSDPLEYLRTTDWDNLEYGLAEIILAGRLFWNRHQRVPRSLDELVDEQLLQHVPEDPFGEGPLKYDPERGLVWSVMHNGVDDRGESADDHEYDPDDERDDIASPMPRF